MECSPRILSAGISLRFFQQLLFFEKIFGFIPIAFKPISQTFVKCSDQELQHLNGSGILHNGFPRKFFSSGNFAESCQFPSKSAILLGASFSGSRSSLEWINFASTPRSKRDL